MLHLFQIIMFLLPSEHFPTSVSGLIRFYSRSRCHFRYSLQRELLRPGRQWPSSWSQKALPGFAKYPEICFELFFTTMGVNFTRSIQGTFLKRRCYLGTYFKTLTDTLSVISIHIMSQTICSRMGEMNWLCSSFCLIINIWCGCLQN